MNQQPYDSSPQSEHSPYSPEYQEPVKQSNFTLASIALACGTLSAVLNVPVLDIILGIAGIILAAVAMRGQGKGMAIAGLIVSIIGIYHAFNYTAQVLGWFANDYADYLAALMIRCLSL